MSRPTVDQASKQNIGDSEFVNLVVSMKWARYCFQFIEVRLKFNAIQDYILILKMFVNKILAFFVDLWFRQIGWHELDLLSVKFKFISVSTMKVPAMSDWPYLRKISGNKKRFTNSSLPWKELKKRLTSVSKKLGQTTVVIQYCSLSRFFWNKRYLQFWK